MERKLFNVEEFSKGQLSSLADEKIPKNGAKVAQNCYIDLDGTIVKRDRQIRVETIGETGEYIRNHCLYAKTTGERYDVVAINDGASDTRIFYKQRGTSGAFTEITGFATGFGNSYDVEMLSYADVIWFVDGSGNPYHWDGTTLTDISAGAGGELWAADLEDPQYIAEAQGAIYLAGYTGDPAAIYHSVYYDSDGDFIRATNADAWAADQIVKIEDAGEIITGMYSYNDRLMIFTQNYVYMLSGYVSQINPSLRRIYSDDGCISNKSIAEVDGNLMWVGQKGVYSYNGQQINLVSNGVKDYFEWMKHQSLYNLRLLLDTRTEFRDFDYLKNADFMAIDGSIVSGMYPDCRYSAPTNTMYFPEDLFTGDGIKTRRGIAQKIYVDRNIETDHLYIKFGVETPPLAESESLNISISSSLTPSAISATTTLTFNESVQEKEVDLGSVSLTADTYYYVLFYLDTDLISPYWFNIRISEGNWNSSNIITDAGIYRKTTSSDSWTEQDLGVDTIGLDIVLIPDNMEIWTDIYYIEDAKSINKFHIETDSDYADETNSYYYRYSTTSEDDLPATWTSVSNDADLSLTPNSDTYIQFRMVMGNTVDENNYQQDSAKIEHIQVAYTTGTAASLNIYGVEFDRRYFVSIPTKGTLNNDKTFVFDGKAWTYYDLKTLCMYENDDELYYGLADQNELYQLSFEDSSKTDEWNTEDDWEGYALDSNCDDDTDSGSLQADYTADEIDDEFTGTALDDKWTENAFGADTTASVADGKLKVETAGGVADSYTVYQNCSDDSTRATSYTLECSVYLQGADGDGQTYLGIDMMLGNDDASSLVQNSIDARYNAATDVVSFWSDLSNSTDGTSVTGITTCPDVVYLRLVFTWDATTPTMESYYKIEDTGSWMLAHTRDVSVAISSSIDTIHIDRVRVLGYNWGDADPKYTEMGYINITPDIEISSSIVYYDDAYRIYSYNSDGDLTIYWEGSGATADNTVKIYYASSKVMATLPEDYTINDKYNWTLLGTIAVGALTGDTTFTAPSSKYIKVVFDNTDTSDTALLDRLYIISDEAVEMIWESGLLEMGKSDLEKYVRKAFLDAETDGDMTLYYKTEKMDAYRNLTVSSTDTRISLPAEHGKKIQFKLISDNPQPCKVKHFSIEYKERKLR